MDLCIVCEFRGPQNAVVNPRLLSLPVILKNFYCRRSAGGRCCFTSTAADFVCVSLTAICNARTKRIPSADLIHNTEGDSGGYATASAAASASARSSAALLAHH